MLEAGVRPEPVLGKCLQMNRTRKPSENGHAQGPGHAHPPTPPVDRRVQRTRKVLQEALVALMLEQPYDNITIQHIIDRANVGRSTFYAHYRDKDDLLLRGVAEIAYGADAEVSDQARHPRRVCEAPRATLTMAPMFRHVQANALLHQVMFKKHQENTLLRKATAFLYGNVAAQLEEMTQGRPPAVPVAVMAHYVTGGLMALIEWWMANGRPYTPEEMEALFQAVGVEGIRKTLSTAGTD